MDYKTLMAKIKAAEAAKQFAKQVKKVEPKPAPVVEETPHEVEVKEELPLESEKVEHFEEPAPEAEVKVEEKPVSKKKGKKPANRAYMVVEDIDEVNKEVEKTDLDF